MRTYRRGDFVKTVFIAILLMSMTGSALYLLLLLLRPVTQKRLSATWHYLTCAVVMLFLLIPVSFVGGPVLSAALNSAGSDMPQISSALTEMISSPDNAAAAPADASDRQAASPVQPISKYTETGRNTAAADGTAADGATEGEGTGRTGNASKFDLRSVLTYLPFIWPVGALAFTAAQSIKHTRFKNKLARTNLPVEDKVRQTLFEYCRREMGINRKINLMSSNIVNTPMLMGIFRSVLILPEVEMSDAELRMVFRHELTHLMRHDIWIKLLALVSNTVHWFNPFAYRLRRELDTYCELSCDERVVSDMNPEERRFYGETILNVLCRVTKRREGLFAAFAATRRGFEKRLLRIMDFKKVSNRAAAFSVALLLLLSLIGCAAGGLAGAKMEKTNALTVCIDAAVKSQLTLALDAYKAANPGVKIKYEVLPDWSLYDYYKPENREMLISQLRTQVMAGKGPDLFILQSDVYNQGVPALFQDPEKAMRGGVFCDMLPLFREAEISMDDFIAPVMEAGQVGGKQYIVPLNYQVFGVVTNETTRELMGDDAFKSSAGMLDGLRTMAAAGTGSAYGNSWDNFRDLLYDPYYPANPNPVDYDAQTAKIDTPLLRDILETCKAAIDKSGAPDATLPEISPEFWKDYVQSDQYFAFYGELKNMACEVGMFEAYSGLTPRLDVFPNEGGGVNAEISLYTGIRANSANKLNAVNLLKTLLSAPYQTNTEPDNMMSNWSYGWPVRKGVLAERLKTFVDKGLPWYYIFGFTGNRDIDSAVTLQTTFSAPLSEVSINSFLAVESKITSAAFPPPLEFKKILGSFSRDEIDLDTAIARMQDYWDKSLEE